MAERPLEGRRIVVTRPREQAAPLAEALERLGATVSIVPLVAIEPIEDRATLDAALARGGYDWLVFTSANGVAAVGDRLVGSLGEAKVAAVGPATAEALRSVGVDPAFVPERYAADEIAAGLDLAESSSVLLPQADIADPRLAEELRARGATVEAVVAYRTVELQLSVSGIATLRNSDAVVVSSGSAARSLAAIEVGDGTLLVCIGPKTAEAARQAGLPVGLVAEEATAHGIIQALVMHYEELSP